MNTKTTMLRAVIILFSIYIFGCASKPKPVINSDVSMNELAQLALKRANAHWAFGGESDEIIIMKLCKQIKDLGDDTTSSQLLLMPEATRGAIRLFVSPTFLKNSGDFHKTFGLLKVAPQKKWPMLDATNIEFKKLNQEPPQIDMWE